MTVMLAFISKQFLVSAICFSQFPPGQHVLFKVNV